MMKDQGIMLILIASALGLASSLSVFVLALRKKHKDFYNSALLIPISYDILMSAFGLSEFLEIVNYTVI